MADAQQSNKAHRGSRMKDKAQKEQNRHVGGFNPRAYVSAHPRVADKQIRRNAERDQQRLHVPLVNRTDEEEAPPVIVAIVGPEGVGKTTLMRSLIRKFSKHTLTDVRGPVTVVSGKRRRLTFIECNNDINSMIDIGKIADLVLLMIDGSFGFEMEQMEFLNVLQAHGFPKIIGVLTHLDLIKKSKTLRATKKRLKSRFWTEIYQGAKLFYLSGIINGRYPDIEVQNLSRFIGVMKFRPLIFRNAHPYLLADRMEDLTPKEQVRRDPKGDRRVTVYGYLRGTNMRHDTKVHIPGVGDLSIASVERLNDPCALPTSDSEKRRKLSDKAKTIHAPMSDVGGVMFDKDAVYINVPGHFSKNGNEEDGTGADGDASRGEGERMVLGLQDARNTLDEGVQRGEMRLFSDEARPLSLDEVVKKKQRERKAAFDDVQAAERESEDGDEDIDDDDEEENDDDDEDSDDEEAQAREEELGAGDEEGGDGEIAFADSDSDMGHQGEDSDNDDDDDVGGDNAWKRDLAAQAEQTVLDNRRRKAPDLMRLIYHSDQSPEEIVAGHDGRTKLKKAILGDEEDDEGDFFQLADEDDRDAGPDDEDLQDFSKPRYSDEELKRWDDEIKLDSIRHLFITGAEDEEEEGDEQRVDEGFQGFSDDDDDDNEGEGGDEGKEEDGETARAEALAKKKAALKRRFDEQYDDPDEAMQGDWYDEQKAELAKQAEANRAAFEDDDEETRRLVEGFRPGAYVRMELAKVPCEMVDNFDPRYPLIVGGLLASEEQMGYVQVRIKKHRWHHRILKTNDPLVFSIGWRRFQSVPVYSLDDGTRNRMLKYTPEHMHCLATFWAPAARPNTGFCAFNTLDDETPRFRVSATGTVLDVDAGSGAHKIVKKLKLTGTPAKVYKNTAFIKDMFNSRLEIARFEGAHIKTVSGIRGMVKKALAKPEGHFRATFEDKVLMSDIVFLRCWYSIEPRRFYNPVTSLLLATQNRQQWKGMRLTGTVRKEEAIKTPNRVNSIYKPVQRAEVRKFNKLKIPKSLQAQLPYASKIKNETKKSKKSYLDQRAVVMEKEEREAVALLQQMRAVQREKEDKRKAKKQDARKKHMETVEKEEAIKKDKRKAALADVYRAQGQREAKKQKTQ